MRGFSLIEVVIALGIMSFTGVVILGLLATGQAASQQSTTVTIASRLAVEVQAELQEAGTTSWPTNTTYFDGEGRVSSEQNRIYEVWRTVQNGSLPGTNSSPFKRAVVQILKNPAHTYLQRGTNGLVVVPPQIDERSFLFHVLAN
ncbi:MAG: hypothetical protein WC765_09690 [Phycisphaerae bacterium]|jgi:uncharacterized protein (TIGR02598 family)